MIGALLKFAMRKNICKRKKPPWEYKIVLQYKFMLVILLPIPLPQNKASKFEQRKSYFAAEILLVHHRRLSGLHANAKASNGKSVLGSVCPIPGRYIRHGSSAID
jgi:hypothetical protein